MLQDLPAAHRGLSRPLGAARPLPPGARGHVVGLGARPAWPARGSAASVWRQRPRGPERRERGGGARARAAVGGGAELGEPGRAVRARRSLAAAAKRPGGSPRRARAERAGPAAAAGL